MTIDQGGVGACRKVLTLSDAQLLGAFALLINTAVASPEINPSTIFIFAWCGDQLLL